MKVLRTHPADLGFILLVGAYVFICWTIVIHAGHAERFSPLMYLGTGAQMTATFLLGYILYRLFRALGILLSPSLREAIATKKSSNNRFAAPPTAARADGPWALIVNDLKSGPLRIEIITRAAPVFIAFFFFFSTFTSMKFLIADIQPFAWDEFFMRADLFLHFGLDPWRILQPVFGFPIVTKIIAFVYILWLPAFFLVLYWQLFRFENDALRMRFFYAFVLTWAVNGTFLAILFSSAGPCYYWYVTGSGHFTPLMDYLSAANEKYAIYSVSTQAMLWKNYMDKSVILGGGVSAFPSVHVATVFLFVLMSRHIGKAAYALFIAFFLLILLGSIHLGWHYAADGYFSILTTWILWRLTAVICPERK